MLLVGGRSRRVRHATCNDTSGAGRAQIAPASLTPSRGARQPVPGHLAHQGWCDAQARRGVRHRVGGARGSSRRTARARCRCGRAGPRGSAGARQHGLDVQAVAPWADQQDDRVDPGGAEDRPVPVAEQARPSRSIRLSSRTSVCTRVLPAGRRRTRSEPLGLVEVGELRVAAGHRTSARRRPPARPPRSRSASGGGVRSGRSSRGCPGRRRARRRATGARGGGCRRARARAGPTSSSWLHSSCGAGTASAARPACAPPRGRPRRTALRLLAGGLDEQPAAVRAGEHRGEPGREPARCGLGQTTVEPKRSRHRARSTAAGTASRAGARCRRRGRGSGSGPP